MLKWSRPVQVEIMMAMEEAFDLELDEDQAENITTVQQAADLIAAQVSAAHEQALLLGSCIVADTCFGLWQACVPVWPSAYDRDHRAIPCACRARRLKDSDR